MIRQVQRVGFTVSDLDRVLAFYTQILPFEIINDCEVLSEPCEKLTGVFGARMRVVTLGLGLEQIQLTQFTAPPGGRPFRRTAAVTICGFSTSPSSSAI